MSPFQNPFPLASKPTAFLPAGLRSEPAPRPADRAPEDPEGAGTVQRLRAGLGRRGGPGRRASRLLLCHLIRDY